MKKIETISLSARQASYFIMLSLPLFIFGMSIFNALVGVGDNQIKLSLSGLIAIQLSTIILHELLHGLGFLLGGAKPSYGVGIGYFYATSKQKLPLKHMLRAGYLLLVSLSLAFIVIGLLFPKLQLICSIGFITNFTGAIGDAWLMSKLWKYRRFDDVLIQDQKFGTEVFSNDPKAIKAAKICSKKSQTKIRWIEVALSSVFVIFVIQFFLPFFLPETNFYLMKFSGTNSANVEWNLIPGMIGGAIIGLLYLITIKAMRKYEI